MGFALSFVVRVNQNLKVTKRQATWQLLKEGGKERTSGKWRTETDAGRNIDRDSFSSKYALNMDSVWRCVSEMTPWTCMNNRGNRLVK